MLIDATFSLSSHHSEVTSLSPLSPPAAWCVMWDHINIVTFDTYGLPVLDGPVWLREEASACPIAHNQHSYTTVNEGKGEGRVMVSP